MPAESVQQSGQNQKSILVVEDDEMLLDLVTSLLAENGYHVIQAKDGLAAVEQYRLHHEKISLVLSDMGLPNISGWEAFLRMKEINPNVKSILASGFFDPKLRKEMMAAGAVDFVQKPYMMNEVLKKIQDVIA